ncbi:MAG: hypothetical protein OXE50_01985, partial [Chloroflexi bacterium]|nr:hypothetical protein [Chloroflexota bacterium]
ALIRNFVEGIEVNGDEAVLTYTVPMPSDGVRREKASVLDFVQSSPPNLTIDRTIRLTTSVGRRPSPAAALFIMPRNCSIPATF